MIKILNGSIDFLESLRGKKANLLLSLSNSKTAQIDGITQAGISGFIYLTPTIDSEYLCSGEVRSLSDIATTSSGVPSPAIITRAIHLLKPFNNIELLDLGLQVKPKLEYFNIYDFNISPSNSIDQNANIDAKALFEKGLEFGQKYNNSGDYIILGESVPSGTTTAMATAIALGYDVVDKFSSSFKNVPIDIKLNTIKKALLNIDKSDDLFDILGKVSDNMLIFNAGFIIGLNGRYKLILAGGTQMAGVLLIVDTILKAVNKMINTNNISLWTTKWVAKDNNSDIKALLNMLSFKINAYYSDFDFHTSNNKILKLYDNAEAKEGVGAGGALVYGLLNGLDKQNIIDKIETLL